MSRYDLAAKIATLDPQADAIQICHLLAGYEFPWDITRALELALLRTFCIPSVAALLDRTGEFHHHTQKRYDDTGIIVSELFKWGYEDPRGQAFLQRMNAIHQHFPIRNDDYLYVLSTFIYEPIRWCNRFGWRALSPVETHGIFHFWQAVGRQMGIKHIPDDYAEFEAYNQAYEQTHFHYTPANQRVADATRAMMVNWFPLPLRGMVNFGIPALLDPALLTALGWQAAPTVISRIATTALQQRSRLLRQLPPREVADFFVDQTIHSYPNGFDIADIGPPTMLDALNQKGRPNSN
ncbi:DUF2236 domain-containing protein [filamentous cyanobacterium LEGE 11480]|uniref:DUF2236 domain-containing protein n=2 Tax=Romeriopsis TaxID=2992131 RepID=A0A928Z6T1_9CYAN|nr:DUF2236 domain-containing protein [Romeriopsis navalis LEGE 11480]